MDLKRIIRAARGEGTVDLLLTHARIVNVFSGEIVSNDIAVACGRIVGFGAYDAKKRIDVGGRFVAPGFIDSHVHIESAMASDHPIFPDSGLLRHHHRGGRSP